MMRNGLSHLGVLTLLLVLQSAAGCCGGMGRYDVDVMLDPSVGTADGFVPSIEVDIVAVNQSEYPLWEAYSMSQYWRPGDVMRRDADKYVMRFGQQSLRTQWLSRGDPIWEKWKAKKATHLFILAFLPGAFEDRPGNADARRLILPLNTCRWPRRFSTGLRLDLWRGREPIVVVVKSSQLLAQTQPEELAQ